MALLLLVQAVTAAAPTKQLEVVDTVDVEVATKNSFGCFVAGESLIIMILMSTFSPQGNLDPGTSLS